MKIGIIGLGLIGGSMALTLRKKGYADYFIGTDRSAAYEEKAMEIGIVDKVMPLEEVVNSADVVIIAVPVDAAALIAGRVLDLTTDQVIMDVGSTKSSVIRAVSGHPKRGRFVATRPIWGTEFSGPAAARPDEMRGKLTVICNPNESDEDALGIIESIYTSLGMEIVYQEAESHDLHAAYVSHISHLTSFALALAVLDKEKEEEQIFRLAGAGFQSTVRLAKSNPDTWVPIFRDNRSNVLDVLNDQIFFLKQMKKLIEMEEYDALHKLLADANRINRIIK